MSKQAQKGWMVGTKPPSLCHWERTVTNCTWG